ASPRLVAVAIVIGVPAVAAIMVAEAVAATIPGFGVRGSRQAYRRRREQTYGPLRAGQVVFVGTDGGGEMPDAKGEAFEKERVREIIREFADRPAAEISATIHDQLTRFRGDAKQVDDVTYVMIKLAPTVVTGQSQ